MENKDDVLDFCISKVENYGYFECSNLELANKVYDILKPKYPTLYQYINNQTIYVEIIEKNKYNELLTRRNEYIKEVVVIDSILEELNKGILKDLKNE